jgi:hypothetical protein
MVFQNKTVNSYENMVNRRLAHEQYDFTTFTVGPRAWGTRRKNRPFVDHNGQVYLEVIFLHAGKKTYLVDGQPFTGHIDGLQEEREEGNQGGLVNKVIIRTYNIDNIKSITINNEHYDL